MSGRVWSRTTDDLTPLPSRASAFWTYAWAAGVLLPTIFVFGFAIDYILPKLVQIWQLAGLTGSKVQWPMNTCYGMKQHLHLIAATLFIVFFSLELFGTGWPRYRRAVITL